MYRLLQTPSLILALIASSLLLVPFVILELVNRGKFNENFPLAIFVFAWVLQVIFVLMALPIVKDFRSGRSLVKNPIIFLLRIIGMVVVVYIWMNWVVDQWPCLMGVPNCD